MPWKMDGDTLVVVEGNPVWVGEDGAEVGVDYASTLSAIKAKNHDAMTQRQAKEAAEAKLVAFEGLDDPDAARKALETVASLDGGSLLDAEKAAEAQKAAVEAATKAMSEKVAEANGRAEAAASALNKEVIGGAFARSSYIREKLTVPVDMVQATFGSAFTVEDGRAVAKDASGNVIFSDENPGEVAGFDEAIRKLVAAHPNRDQILKGVNAGGAGAKPGAGGAGTGAGNWSDAKTAKDKVAVIKAKREAAS